MDFDAVPTVAVLQRLVPGSLKQGLAKAVRQWVILRSLYGELGDEVRVDLEVYFSYRDWAGQFFSVEPQGRSYHLRDRAAPVHDSGCACAKFLADWLFDSEYGAQLAAWQAAFQQRYGVNDLEMAALLRSGKLAVEAPELRLFGCTGKLLEKDFEDLEKLGWLRAQTNEAGSVRRNHYEKVIGAGYVEKVSGLSGLTQGGVGASAGNDIANFIQTDLAVVAESMARPIRGVQRFFLHTDYIVPVALSAQVSAFQEILLGCWERSEVPPIRLVYRSARRYDEEVHCVVYPVCIYYFQRAPYLFAYGEVPGGVVGGKGGEGRSGYTGFDWYDYRLDHIQQIAVMDWAAAPVGLAAECKGASGPSPAVVQDKMLEAWGFDFYRPATDLVLRFDRYFYAQYVEQTERATFLQRLSYQQVEGLVKRAALKDERLKGLVVALKDRSPEDEYRRVSYRVGDNNVVMRLRAWGANVEVLLPGDLRERMGETGAAALEAVWGALAGRA